MQQLDAVIEVIRQAVKRRMTGLARFINRVSKGRITPASITYTGLVAHFFIAWLIATQMNLLAAILLVIFGLFDALDGALARLQNTAGNSGMLLDASTDRIKEVLLYSGAAYALTATGYPTWTPWAVAACGASLCVSYIKAKGETAIKDAKLSPNEINRLFADGIMRFEIRMAVLIISLLTNNLRYGLVFIAVTSGLTAIGRLQKIMRKL